MKQSALDLLQSPEFARMVRRRWTVSLVFTTALFAIYYGYIFLIATRRAFVAQKVDEGVTLGILLGVGVILGSCVLTGAYVIWANRVHDADVRELKRKAQGREA